MAAANSSTARKSKAAPTARNTQPEFGLFSLESITGDGQKKIAERYYQVEAVKAIVAALRHGGRGQLRSACGTGKTVMAQRAAELLCPAGGLVVILCPSIELVAQTLREWEANNWDHISLGVCGDDTVIDAVITVDDIPATVTTDPGEVATWLTASTTVGIRLIVGTHRSAHVIGTALRTATSEAELLIVDEAHRSAGPVGKHVALVHDNDQLPAKRRLYATATPKVLGEKAKERGDAKLGVGMDNRDVFGPVLYNYPFSRAIEDGYLDDYRLVVMGATRAEIRAYLSDLPPTATATSLTTSLHTAMVQTVMAKAAVQYGLRRVLTFCNRLNEAEDFARTMRTTLSALPPEAQPPRKLNAACVHGGMNAAERRKRLQWLREPPQDGWTVITNVRCLTEGVDVPAIDGVAFTHPKQSIIEIVQAVGRALRRDLSGTGTATILVPILLPDNPTDLDEDDISGYRLLWQVVKALRAHDDKLGATIDRANHHSGRASSWAYDDRPLEHLRIDLPPDYDDGSFLQHLTAQIITSARSEWWNGYTALAAFHTEHNHTTFDRRHVTADNFQLGAWAYRTRSNYWHGRLAPDRVAALTELGFDLSRDAVEWAAGLQAAHTFHTEHKHLEPVRSLRVDDVELHSWLAKRREQRLAGVLDEDRIASLDELGMRWHDRPDTFDEYLAALTAFHAEHGHIDIPPDRATEEGYLGSWLVSQRIQRKLGKLAENEIDALDALGMSWKPPQPALPVETPTPPAPTTPSAATATRSRRATPQPVSPPNIPSPAPPQTSPTPPPAPSPTSPDHPAPAPAPTFSRPTADETPPAVQQRRSPPLPTFQGAPTPPTTDSTPEDHQPTASPHSR